MNPDKRKEGRKALIMEIWLAWIWLLATTDTKSPQDRVPMRKMKEAMKKKEKTMDVKPFSAKKDLI